MNVFEIRNSINKIAALGEDILAQSSQIKQYLGQNSYSLDPFTVSMIIFVLACFLGYYVIWRVTPSLHSPLMAVTNAISSVIIIAALIAAGPLCCDLSSGFGLVAIFLASVNIFGGFMITERMLSMFNKKQQKEGK